MNIFLSRVARQTSLRKPILNLASGYQCISSVVTSSSTKSWKRAVFDAECLVNHKGSVINPSDLLGDDLQVITENIRKLLGSGHPVLNTISSYYFNKKGKHIRPLIILLMSRAAYMSKGFQNQTNIDSQISISSDIRFTPNSYSPNDFILDTQRRLAEIVEMIHTASLLHDDVIDDSLKRRSQPSVNAKYGNKMAILAGDFLLSRASVALARLHNFEVVELIAEVISNLVEGEFMQLRHNLASTNQVSLNERWNTSFDYYLDKTYMKTASLIAKSCRASVVLSNASPDMSNAAYNYGKNIGIAFQLIDDMLDFTSSFSIFGKPVNADLNLGLATAPVLYAAKEFPELWPLIDRRFSIPGDVQFTIDKVFQSKGIESTKNLAHNYTAEAIKSLSSFPTSAALDSLKQLAISITEREK